MIIDGKFRKMDQSDQHKIVCYLQEQLKIRIIKDR